MSRLLDHLKNAERKRRDLREQRSGDADSATSPPDQARRAAPAGAPGPRKEEAARTASAADELYWAEVRRRLAELEQQRRMRDTFSPEEERALARAAGAKAQLTKFEAETQARETLERDAAMAEARKIELAREAL